MNQEEMALRLVDVEARSKSNTHRIDELQGQIDAVNRLATAVEVMATKQDAQADKLDEMRNTVNNLDSKVDAIEKKPAKRWDGIVDKFVAGLVSALAAAIFAGIVYLITVGAGG